MLLNLDIKPFNSRDEKEIACYAEAIELVFNYYQDTSLTENYIKQLHNILFKYSSKDTRHHGNYRTFSNNIEAFDTKSNSLGIVFKIAPPFDTPFKMQSLV